MMSSDMTGKPSASSSGGRELGTKWVATIRIYDSGTTVWAQPSSLWIELELQQGSQRVQPFANLAVVRIPGAVGYT